MDVGGLLYGDLNCLWPNEEEWKEFSPKAREMYSNLLHFTAGLMVGKPVLKEEDGGK